MAMKLLQALGFGKTTWFIYSRQLLEPSSSLVFLGFYVGQLPGRYVLLRKNSARVPPKLKIASARNEKKFRGKSRYV